jgi:hypothetical protein
MSESSEYGAELGQDDALVGEAPAGDETPGDYMSNDQSGGTLDDTGVVYDGQGEPQTTPQDTLPDPDDTDVLVDPDDDDVSGVAQQ